MMSASVWARFLTKSGDSVSFRKEAPILVRFVSCPFAFDGFDAPPDRMVPFRKLHDAVSECADPNDRMVRSRRVACEVKEISARRRLVRDGPEVTEIPPDVYESVAGEVVTIAVADQLQ